VDMIGKLEAKARRKARRAKGREAKRDCGARAHNEDEDDDDDGEADSENDVTMGEADGDGDGGGEGGGGEGGGGEGGGGHGAGGSGPQWLAGHRILLPADAEQRHAAAMADPSPISHALVWEHLREAQDEDEQNCRNARKRRMKWLTKARDINRSSYSSLKVDPALHVLSVATADQLRLRRHGGWV
jgi:hypothetical protein